MKSVIATIVVLFGMVSAIAVAVAIGSIINGYVLSVLWGWFIVPTFELPELQIAPAIGVAMVVSYLTYQPQPNSSEDSDGSKTIAIMIARPLLTLFFGWIVQMFM